MLGIMMKKKTVKDLLKTHEKLVHSENVTVVSHVQREQDEWFVNTVMMKGCNAPFKYKRKKVYKSLAKQQVNMTYYASTETIAGFDIEIMNIVRIKVA
jgi:hypothetical protein